MPFTLGADTCHAQEVAPVFVPDADDLWIIELRLRGRTTIAADVLAYGDGRGRQLFVPLAEVLDALGFVIDSDMVAGGPVRGWFIRENQRFSFDPATGSGLIAGRAVTLPSAAYLSGDEGIYLPLDTLSDWFQLDATWDRGQQSITINPAYLLPAEEAARRGNQRSASGGPVLNPAQLPRAPDDYAWAAWPHASATLSLAHEELGSGSEWLVQGSAILRGDFLKLNGELFVSGGGRGAVQSRLRLGRVDPEPRLLGPLGATRFEVGDISLSAAPLIQQASSGMGLRIAREPVDATGAFGRTRLEGNALAGWLAELYRDGELLGFQTIGSDGRYLFDDVPLLFGRNRFRVELYGPQGQRRTDDVVRDISSALVRPNELNYAIEFLDAGRFLLDGRRDRFNADFDPIEGEELPLINQLFFDEGRRAQATASYGLSRNLTVRALTSWQEQRGDDPDGDVILAGGGATIGLGTGNLSALVTGDVIVDDSGAVAGRLGLAGTLGGLSLIAEHEQFGAGFRSDANRTLSLDIAEQTSVRADGRLQFSDSFDLGVGASLARSLQRDGSENIQSSLRVSGRFADISATHSLNWQRTSIVAQSRRDRIGGAASLAGRIGPVRLRAGLDYEVAPDTLIRSAGLDGALRLSQWTLNLRSQRDFRTDSYQLQAGASRDWNGVRIGAEVRHETRANTVRALLTLSFDLDRSPQTGALRIGQDASSGRGSAEVRVFQDLDGNGARGPGEPLIEAMRVQMEPRGRIEPDAAGTVWLENLQTARLTGVAVDTAELEDPFAIASTPGAAFVPRPGAVSRIELPVVESVEIEALLLGADGEELANRVVSLLDCEGSQIARVRTAYDGVAIFDLLPSGCYYAINGEIASSRATTAPGESVSLVIRLIE